ncbi:MAG: hypothetical protein ACPL1K_00870 [Candidatus Kryptoniota bacterium]
MLKKYFFQNVFITVLLIFFIGMVSFEFYQICQGTGNWFGGFSLKWGVIFFLILIFNFTILLILLTLVWNNQWLDRVGSQLLSVRKSLKYTNWILSLIIFLFPYYLLLFTPWGAVFYRPFIRLFIWFGSVILVTFFLEVEEKLLSWKIFFVVLLLSGFCVISANFLKNVSNYPFSLTWSEGNRLWDYSMLFGRSRYIFSETGNISVHLDIGRQLVGGIPFLYSKLNIIEERFWLAIVNIIAYLLLGWTLFYIPKVTKKEIWILLGCWVMLFLMQGPIHTPLIVAALLVGLAWERPVWISMILMFLAGYIAQASRFTWMFAPAILGVGLEFVGAKLENGKISSKTWTRSLWIGVSGLLGGIIFPKFLELIKDYNRNSINNFMNPQIGLSFQQPLLWYRLFPNPTYPTGIILSLIIATIPIILLLILTLRKKIWIITSIQKLYLILMFISFLIVGLIVSVKIGGGGDLHNLDMFLLGLIFCAAIVWRRGGIDWILLNLNKKTTVHFLFASLIIIPIIPYLMNLFPLSFTDSIGWVATLTDKNPNSLNSLPNVETTKKSLQSLQTEITKAQLKGEILFMDQRQLLTFGYIKDVVLVPEYEKKVLIDQAMARNAGYFKSFYKDISTHRFALIVTFPQSLTKKDREYNFKEENNIWLKWVTIPLLCYYTPLMIYPEVNVELLIPKDNQQDCSQDLPVSISW